MIYAILNTDMQVNELRNLDPIWVQNLINTGNPKANYILPFIQEPEPIYDPKIQILEEGEYIIEQNQVKRGWILRNLTEEEIAEKNRKIWTAYEFLTRFTQQERAALRTAGQTDTLVADFSQLLGAAQEVISDDPVTIQAMDYLVYAGYITNDRRNAIMDLPTT